MLDKATHTRKLIEASGFLALQLPTQAMVAMTTGLSSDSANDVPHKLQKHDVQLFTAPGSDIPLVESCVGWLACKLVPEPHNQQAYNLFIGEVVGAWADDRVFQNGHWSFDHAPDALRTIHHVAGGQYFVTGSSVRG